MHLKLVKDAHNCAYEEVEENIEILYEELNDLMCFVPLHIALWDAFVMGDVVSPVEIKIVVTRPKVTPVDDVCDNNEVRAMQAVFNQLMLETVDDGQGGFVWDYDVERLLRQLNKFKHFVEDVFDNRYVVMYVCPDSWDAYPWVNLRYAGLSAWRIADEN